MLLGPAPSRCRCRCWAQIRKYMYQTCVHVEDLQHLFDTSGVQVGNLRWAGGDRLGGRKGGVELVGGAPLG